MKKLSKREKEKYYKALMEARGEILGQIKFHSDEALNSEKNSAGERSGMSSHMADLGSDNSRHDMELGLLTEEAEVLELIDEALGRLNSDEFGVCMDCECDVQEARLEVKPYARYCIKCKDAREKNDGYNPNYQ
jgi:DnaK suppressor protein